MSIWCSIGPCGFGANLGLFPELRFGLIRIGCCRGAVADHAREARSKLERTLQALVRGSA